MVSLLIIIKQKQLCFNCLAHHRVSQCSSKNRCCKCGGKHHTSICRDTPSKPANTASLTESTPPQTELEPAKLANTTKAFITIAPTKHSTCLLKTAIATVVRTDSQTEANILFNEGSQRSFLPEKLAHELTLMPCRQENINLSSFGAQKPSFKQIDVVLFNIRTLTGELVQLSALVVPTIAIPITYPINTKVLQLPHLQTLPLAHPGTPEENFEISLLIGADH